MAPGREGTQKTTAFPVGSVAGHRDREKAGRAVVFLGQNQLSVAQVREALESQQLVAEMDQHHAAEHEVERNRREASRPVGDQPPAMLNQRANPSR